MRIFIPREKGKMEEDYLTRLCDVPADRVVIGAPSVAREKNEFPPVDTRRFVVFFSEPYEATGGRAEGCIWGYSSSSVESGGQGRPRIDGRGLLTFGRKRNRAPGRYRKHSGS